MFTEEHLRCTTSQYMQMPWSQSCRMFFQLRQSQLVAQLCEPDAWIFESKREQRIQFHRRFTDDSVSAGFRSTRAEGADAECSEVCSSSGDSFKFGRQRQLRHWWRLTKEAIEAVTRNV